MSEHRVTLSLEGFEPGTDNVRLSDFVRELEALRNALRKTEQVIVGHTVLDWQVVDLSHNSPATVSVEPLFLREPLKGAKDRRGDVVAGFFRYVRSLNSYEAPPELDRDALEAFSELAVPVRQRRLRASVSNGHDPAKRIEIAATIEASVGAILAPTTKAHGTVKGRLEFLNIHGGQNVFRVYSPIMPRWVVCHFDEGQLPAAKEVIGRKALVTGELTYRTRDPYPQSVKVERIEALPEDTTLPRLFDLRGAAPDMTGDLLSEDYIREMRSG